ncbi:MAG: glycosyltransferase family 4 protein [Sulfuricaulis sp.]|nr:glycosyltransferase family 4 protein [Sulfuricaulis sp.]
MKILIVSQYFWPESFRINDLALGLKDMGHQVTVLTGIPNYPDGAFFPGYGLTRGLHEDYQGIDIVRAPLISRGRGRGFRLALNYLSFALTASLVGAFFCRGDYDVIFAYEPSPITVGLPAVLLRWLKGAPLIFWVQDLWPESLSATGAVRARFILRLVKMMVRFIYCRCDRILVQSLAFVAPVQTLGARPSDTFYFPNSAEPIYRPVEPAPCLPAAARMPNGFRVMFAGNIGAAQDFETIIEAAVQLKSRTDIHWVILGDGRMYDWVKTQVKARGLEATLHLLGRYPVETMPRLFALADAMLVTLRKEPIFALTIPAKIQSYLACAKPIVAALDGEGSRIIRDAGAGIAVPAGQPAALAEAVLELYRMSPAQRQAMGARARSYFELHFERDMLLRKLNGWMNELKRAD